jgi:hypothetical protein
MPYVRLGVPLGPLLLSARKSPTDASTTNATIAVATNMRMARFATKETCGLTLADVAEVLIEVGLVLVLLVDDDDDDDDDDESPNF